MAMVEERHIGAAIPRKEDGELITGVGMYTDDLTLPGMLSMVVVRSPFAHARLTGVDVSRAREMPGVLAAFSAAGLEKTSTRNCVLGVLFRVPFTNMKLEPSIAVVSTG